MAVNPAALNALTLQYGQQRADLDDQENRYRINYNNVMDKMKRSYRDGAESANVGFADRGMLHSGPSLQNTVDMRDDFNRSSAQAAQTMNTDLATLARKRLDAGNNYNMNKILTSLGIAS